MAGPGVGRVGKAGEQKEAIWGLPVDCFRALAWLLQVEAALHPWLGAAPTDI